MHLRIRAIHYAQLTLVIFALATPAQAQWRCFKWGIFGRLFGTGEKLTVETRAPRDQGCYGSCWLQAGIGSLETDALSHSPTIPSISVDALIVRDLQFQVEELLFDPNSEFSEGGNARRARQLIRMYGLVPESEYRIRSSITSNIWEKVRFFNALNTRLDEYRSARSRLGSTESLSEAEKTQRQLLFDQVYREARRDLLALIEHATGPVPTEFVVDGEKTTSREFGRKYFDPEKRAIELVPPQFTTEEEVIESRNKQARLMRSFQKGPTPFVPKSPPLRSEPANVASLKKPLPQIKKSLLDAFRAGRQINIAVIWNDADLRGNRLDVRTPKISDTAYSHALQVVGLEVVKRDGVDEVVAIEVQNSWGMKSGKRGRYVISAAYFDRYLLSALIEN